MVRPGSGGDGRGDQVDDDLVAGQGPGRASPTQTRKGSPCSILFDLEGAG